MVEGAGVFLCLIWFLPLLDILKDPFENELVFAGVFNLPEGLEKVEAGVVTDCPIAAVDFFLHKHRAFDVVDLGVGPLSASLHELQDSLKRGRIL